MPTIYVDNQPYTVKPGQNLLHACLTLGFNIPYFCWHPAFGSVGACRQCAVVQFKDEHDEQGKIVMSCMTPANDDTRISIDHPKAIEFRAKIIEWMMTNHPHDCPVCDEGGECHLQDMTVMTGHNYRSFRFKKRTHRNQYLGPFINHEMNRCIACYRCVRFYNDHALGTDLNVFAAHNFLYFGRQKDGVLESEFSGNLVEVCPTGVFTDKSLKSHYTRKWDLQTAPSICTHCSLGCNTIPGERYGTLRRIRNRYHSQVNGYFLCDRGRYGYEFVNSEKRIKTPYARNDGSTNPLSQEEILQNIASLFTDTKTVMGIGSPRASVEANFALLQLVGADHFYNGMNQQESKAVSEILHIYQNGSVPPASLKDVEKADAVLVLGEDVTNSAPLLDLAIKQAIKNQPKKAADKLKIDEWNAYAVRYVMQNDKGSLMMLTPFATKLDRLASSQHRAAPDDIARLGFAVAHAIDESAPAVQLTDEENKIADQLAETLQNAERPMIVSGTGCAHIGIIQAAANIARALEKKNENAGLCYAVPEANSVGAALMSDQHLSAAIEHIDSVRTLVILENDLTRRLSQSDFKKLLNVENVIVLDYLENATTAAATFVLPAAPFSESDGTFVNNEGRAQRFYKVMLPRDESRESWKWLQLLGSSNGKATSMNWRSFHDLMNATADTISPLSDINKIVADEAYAFKFPRQPFRYSGRTAMHANVNVSEPQQPQDIDTPLSFSMEGFFVQTESSLIDEYWAPGWNSVQALTRFQQEVGGTLIGGDPGVHLLQPGNKTPSYFDTIPHAFQAQKESWLLLPIYHIFGSEELSVLSSGIAELMPEPYVLLHPDDAQALDVSDGDTLTVESVPHPLTVKLDQTLIKGIAGLPAGLPLLSGIDFFTRKPMSPGVQR